MKVILVNGPPRSGKDTAGNLLMGLLRDVELAKFARVIKDAAHAIYGMPEVHFEHFDKCKDQPNPIFLGKTPREVYIAVSETYMKPMHGDRVFGELLARRLHQSDERYAVVTDSGFRGEAEVLVDEFGAENVLLINLAREGCTFEGDSRGYISLDDLGVRRVNIDNSAGLETLQGRLKTAVDKWEE